jgi:hypothetical protein
MGRVLVGVEYLSDAGHIDDPTAVELHDGLVDLVFKERCLAVRIEGCPSSEHLRQSGCFLSGALASSGVDI